MFLKILGCFRVVRNRLDDDVDHEDDDDDDYDADELIIVLAELKKKRNTESTIKTIQ